MPRPTNEQPTLTAFCRGNKTIKPVYIRYSYHGIRHQGIAVPEVFIDPNFLGKDNFVKTGKPGYLEANRAIEEVLECIKEAHDTLVNRKVAFTAVMLSALASELLNKVKAIKAADAAEELKKARSARFDNSLDGARKIVEIGSIPEDELAIEKLERELAKKKRELAAIKKKHNVNNGDKLTDWLHNYNKRSGEGTTVAASTLRGLKSFINTVDQFDHDARLGDVDDQWLIRFQQWMNTVPSKTPIYSQKVDPGTNKRINHQLLRVDTGEVRKNSTVENYISKIKSCLKYYEAYHDLLPEGVSVNPKYKRYSFNLITTSDDVIPLTEEEVLEIQAMEGFTKNKEKARLFFLFLCATSLRYSDASEVTEANVEDGYITLRTQKGKKLSIKVHIPVNPVSQYVLDRCNNSISSIAMDDNYLNQYIVEICSELKSMQKKIIRVDHIGADEIKLPPIEKYKCIRSHSGRRTHINILLDYNTPLPIVMSITGHTNLKTLQGYVDSRTKKAKKPTLNIFNIPVYN